MVGHISLAYIYHSRRPGAEEVSEEHIRRERDCEKVGFLDNFYKGIAEPRSNFTTRRRQSIRDQKAPSDRVRQIFQRPNGNLRALVIISD
jgi:hypothetical protein